jgi:hypothetical protein
MNIIEKIYWRTYYTIKDFIYSIKMAYQRVFRGYDDLAKWNLESHLAQEIKEVTFMMAQDSCGYPNGLTEKKWKQILLDISFGFGSYIEMRSGVYMGNEPEYKRLKKEFNKGMELFAKHYGSLWD